MATAFSEMATTSPGCRPSRPPPTASEVVTTVSRSSPDSTRGVRTGTRAQTLRPSGPQAKTCRPVFGVAAASTAEAASPRRRGAPRSSRRRRAGSTAPARAAGRGEAGLAVEDPEPGLGVQDAPEEGRLLELAVAAGPESPRATAGASQYGRAQQATASAGCPARPPVGPAAISSRGVVKPIFLRRVRTSSGRTPASDSRRIQRLHPSRTMASDGSASTSSTSS